MSLLDTAVKELGEASREYEHYEKESKRLEFELITAQTKRAEASIRVSLATNNLTNVAMSTDEANLAAVSTEPLPPE